MIYKGHDLRFERNHIRITNLVSGYTWTEDTIKNAKDEIDLLTGIRASITKEADKFAKNISNRLSK